VVGGGGTAESSPLYKTPTNWAVSAAPRPSSLVREASPKTQNIWGHISECPFSQCPVADAAGGSARARDAPWGGTAEGSPLYKTPTNWAVSAVPRPSSLIRKAAKTQNTWDRRAPQ
jgi:hypothetical protein